MLGYDETTWKHGDVITAAGLNKIEEALTKLSNNTFSSTASYDITSTLPGENNKIATMESISAAITSLTSTLTISNSAVEEGQEYRTIVTAITETAGTLTTAETTIIPIASSTTFGLVKVGNNLSISDGSLRGNYGIDNSGGNYSASSNKLATVGTVKTSIANSTTTFSEVSGYLDSQLTITSISGNADTGKLTYSRSPISVIHSQISDVTLSKTDSESAYEIPTIGKTNELITTAVSTLTAIVSGTASTANTISSFSQIDGKVSVTFEPIAISASQVNGIATTAANGLMSSSDKAKLDEITTMVSLTTEQQAERDTAIANEEPWTDPRSPGLIDPADKDLLDETSAISAIFLSNFIITSGNVTGIKVYNAAGTSYKVLTYDEITATAVPIGE